MSQELKSGYRFNGDVEVKGIVYVSATGSVQDLSLVTREVNIYQNIFNHYLECEILVSDALSLIDSFEHDGNQNGGFNGGDVLIISYRTKDTSMEFVNHVFGIYELSNRQRAQEKLEQYILNGISAEAYLTKEKYISRSYGPSTVSDMIKKIVDERLYNSKIKTMYSDYSSATKLNINKTIDIDPSSGLRQIIIPYLSIDDSIDFLSNECDNDNHIPLFSFYENAKGFNFKDFNNLISADPVRKYAYLQSNVAEVSEADKDETSFKDFDKIIAFEVLKQSNIMQNHKKGLFKSRVINVDILKKNSSIYNYDYSKYFSRFNTLQSKQIPGVMEGEGPTYMVQSRIGHDTDEILSSENHLPKQINETLPLTKSYMAHLFNTVVEVTVHGNSDLNVGDVIELQIPNATTLKSKDKKEDKYLSGKYLITKLRNKITKKNDNNIYSTIMECTKDTGIED